MEHCLKTHAYFSLDLLITSFCELAVARPLVCLYLVLRKCLNDNVGIIVGYTVLVLPILDNDREEAESKWGRERWT